VKTNQAAKLNALSDPTRRAIFELIVREPRAVGELAEELPVSRPAVSQHLRVLKGAGLLSVRTEGTRHVYLADPDGIALVRAYYEQLWRTALVAFKNAAEQEK
jgi:DNA-binding transcriptional ArsR family regulator